jgi:hypothetical protein
VVNRTDTPLDWINFLTAATSSEQQITRTHARRIKNLATRKGKQDSRHYKGSCDSDELWAIRVRSAEWSSLVAMGAEAERACAAAAGAATAEAAAEAARTDRLTGEAASPPEITAALTTTPVLKI